VGTLARVSGAEKQPSATRAGQTAQHYKVLDQVYVAGSSEHSLGRETVQRGARSDEPRCTVSVY
jgi:hypothetical protein